MDLNKVMIIGRLTQDPEIRTTPSGSSVASFSVATNFFWTTPDGQKQEKVEFHNIVMWRRLAEIAGQYLAKGSRIYLEGRLQTRDWQAQDGTKRYRTEIVAESMIMLDSANKGQGGAMKPNFSRSQAPSEPVINIDEQGNSNSYGSEPQEDEIKVEDIPF